MVLDLVTRVRDHGQISAEAWRRIDRFSPDHMQALELLGKEMAPAYDYIGRMARTILREAIADTSAVGQP
jgi:hypothetical protein